MVQLDDLYQQLILDHYRRPRNCRRLENPDCKAVGANPLCGDSIIVYLKLTDGVVEHVAFEGAGCAISTASASIMTEALTGKTVEEAKRLFETFHDLVTGRSPQVGSTAELGKLAVFAGVSKYPARVKCATLAWHTFDAALENKNGVVSTE